MTNDNKPTNAQILDRQNQQANLVASRLQGMFAGMINAGLIRNPSTGVNDDVWNQYLYDQCAAFTKNLVKSLSADRSPTRIHTIALTLDHLTHMISFSPISTPLVTRYMVSKDTVCVANTGLKVSEDLADKLRAMVNESPHSKDYEEGKNLFIYYGDDIVSNATPERQHLASFA